MRTGGATGSDHPRTDAFYRTRSLWLDQLGECLDPLDPLPGDCSVDVAIVGAGFTGLWTARALHQRDRHLRIAIIERDIAGFGASGRNGGWASGLFPGRERTLDRRYGPGSYAALRAALRDAIDDIGATVSTLGLDVAYRKAGTLTVVTAPEQERRVRRELESERRGPDPDARWLSPAEVDRYVTITGNRGGCFTPHCARIQPARLARGLAAALRNDGVRIHEATRALAIESGLVRTDRGSVQAPIVVQATEGYSPDLAGQRRRLVPLYSLMVATEVLPDAVWDAIGWTEPVTLTDGRRMIIYAQRTADGRIAFGGRGAPYHFASRTRDSFDHDPAVFARLRAEVRRLFPAVGDARFTHAWGGPLGIARDWNASVGLDPARGFAWAGGYVGDGVTTTNLAGRTLADLITGATTDLTSLPWVHHVSPRWEPEPLRWLGIRSALLLTEGADRLSSRLH